MKPAPLQLLDYFVTDLHFTANSQFKASEEAPATPDDFQLAVDVQRNQENERKWTVFLKLQFQPPAESNTPYRFSVEMAGFFLVLKGFPDDQVDRLVRINGPTMLYGALREMVRDLTSRSPYQPPMVLPSASFYQPGSKEAAKEGQAAEASD